MYLCYIDESGTSSIPGNTSHFVLAGLSVPIWHWRDCDKEISAIRRKHNLAGAEIHTGWILRKYFEQNRIPDFANLDHNRRRTKVEQIRRAELLRLQRLRNPKRYRQTKKNFAKTKDYVHLTHAERVGFIRDIANCVGQWGFARLFAECIDKIHFDPQRSHYRLDEQALDQLVSRFEQYLENIGTPEQRCYGLLIHDNNETVSSRHTKLMKSFHRRGTSWTDIKNIIETPLFVDSELTSMVQIADLCAYALRRYLENNENELFDPVFERADRKGDIVVGVRHFSTPSCACEICSTHRSD